MRTSILLLASILVLLAACSSMSTTQKRAARGAATGAFRGQAAIGATASVAGGYIYDKTIKGEEDRE